MSKYESSEQTYWRNLDELNGTTHVDANRQEFSEGYDAPPTFENPISRRSFMALLSASMAVTAAACRRPDHKLVPSVKGVEYITPGIPNYYSTVFMHKNAAQGLLVKVREGRPVKVEGNDMHPVAGGKSGVLTQASLLSLYDPERIRQAVVGRIANDPKSGGYSTPLNAVGIIANAVKEAQVSGRQVRILHDEHCSPSLAAMMADIEAMASNVKFVTFPSFVADGAAEANKSVLGVDAEFVPNLSKADVIVSVDSDLLGTDRNSVWHTRNFAAMRKPSKSNAVMNKLIAVESQYSLTGSNADQRVRVAPSEYDGFMTSLYNEVASAKGGTQMSGGTANTAAKDIAAQLIKAGERGAVCVGSHLSPYANGLGMAINAMLGSTGEGKVFAQTLPMSGAKTPALEQLRNDLRSGSVGAVLFCDVNPEITADRDMKNLLSSVPKRYSYTLLDDETALTTSINIPSTHQYESWGDAISFDGTLSIQQPLVAPLNEGSLSLGDMLLALAKSLNPEAMPEVKTYFDYVKSRWMAVAGGEDGWTKSLRDGVLSSTVAVPAMSFNPGGIASLKKANVGNGMAVMVMPSYAVYDGGINSNNGWLLECPDPLTKHTWENVALMSHTTADTIGVKTNDVVLVKVGGDRGIEIPVLTQPGMADNVIVTTLGFGRTTGKISAGFGSNAYSILGTNAAVGYYGATVEKTEKRNVIARTQTYFHAQHEKEWKPDASEESNRAIVFDVTLDDVKKGVNLKTMKFDGEEQKDSKFKVPLNIVSGYDYKGHRWGMVIDMSACTGCNA
ncbi:MAG: TAT-variant-translocated molybdopterin oxidoreductase, partial [Candidatus Kapabacteria bacterium]|nr:TAT-variant-translocated molybdopterin oxidoreductase [Candidatus Kapabacteria bacterium]